MSERVIVEVTLERPELDALLAQARQHAMSPEEVEAQRQSWARSMRPEARGGREATPAERIKRAAAHVAKNKSRWIRVVRWVIRFLIRR